MPTSKEEAQARRTPKPSCYFVLGGPGSGKGTLCATLVENHGFVHLSAGDLLRSERNSGSKNAELINSIIAKGEMVPGDITINLIKDAMKKAGWADKRFLIDGFPRNEDNQDGWERILADEVNMEFVLFLDCTEDLMVERIL
jgi:UMP-CMP kinase